MNGMRNIRSYINETMKEMVVEESLKQQILKNCKNQYKQNSLLTSTSFIKKFSATACLFIVLGMSSYYVYASSLGLNIVHFTKDGFVVGKEQSYDLKMSQSLEEVDHTKSVQEKVESSADLWKNEEVYKDLKKMYIETDIPMLLPTELTKQYLLSQDGMRYRYDTMGNLTQKQWEGTFIQEDKKIHVYLDYAKWEGEPDSRDGAEVSWYESSDRTDLRGNSINKTKVKVLKKYVNQDGITFPMASITFSNEKFKIAAMSIRNYVYYLQFYNLTDSEIYRILDSISLF